MDDSPAARFSRSLSQAPAGARGQFAPVIEAFELWIRDLAAVAHGAEEVVVNKDELPLLRTAAKRLPGAATNAPKALEAVRAATEVAQFNVNPQLTLCHLMASLRSALSHDAATV
jgi:hypothetical protein